MVDIIIRNKTDEDTTSYVNPVMINIDKTRLIDHKNGEEKGCSEITPVEIVMSWFVNGKRLETEEEQNQFINWAHSVKMDSAMTNTCLSIGNLNKSSNIELVVSMKESLGFEG